jgi:hypothetical protein
MEFFGRVVVRFSDATSNLISNYIAKHRLKNGEYLFGSFGKDGRMPATIAAWLVKAGIKDGKTQGQTKTPGGINLLRHACISQKIKEEDLIKLSKTMKHSPLATELYMRKIQPLQCVIVYHFASTTIARGQEGKLTSTLHSVLLDRRSRPGFRHQ